MSRRSTPHQTEQRQVQRRELRSYVWGFGLALVLTVLAFIMVRWNVGIPRVTSLIAIGAFALLQMLVHLRFFLHIGFRQQREDLQLIVFSALLLLIMVGGTIWIMGSLATRMATAVQP